MNGIRSGSILYEARIGDQMRMQITFELRVGSVMGSILIQNPKPSQTQFKNQAEYWIQIHVQFS